MRTLPRLALLSALAVTATVGGARASALRMTIEAPHFTCEGRGALLSHAAYVPGSLNHPAAFDAPLPCCDGQIGCAQFLSTNTILHPERRLRG